VLTYIYASLFDSPAQTLVNTVNTVGVMGKGIAKSFRERYPKMFDEYRRLCTANKLSIGNLHLWKSDDRWVLNFPTKTTWRLPSKIDYIEAGLETFARNYASMGVTSVSFPPLGCGNGNLNWDEVRPLMEMYLSKLSIPVYIHSLHVGAEFVPEHKETAAAPDTFTEFLSDIRACVLSHKGSFVTVEGNKPFGVSTEGTTLAILRGGRLREKILPEELQEVWVVLRDGYPLFVDRFSNEAARRNKSYLFPILRSLPYIRAAQIAKSSDQISAAQALYFVRQTQKSKAVQAIGPEQACLSL
jgi:O-acetyl-ADP-ribose deacetylase (regulator of RNase III)